MRKDHSNTESETLQQQLVAYLDGELDPQQSRRIEEMLANDPEVQKSLQQLDRTWGLLDELDTSEVSSEAAQSTLEMVALEVGQDAIEQRTALPRRRRRRLAIFSGSLSAAAVAGVQSRARRAMAGNPKSIRLR